MPPKDAKLTQVSLAIAFAKGRPVVIDLEALDGLEDEEVTNEFKVVDPKPKKKAAF